MEDILQTTTLGALLHDVGKFAQRANRPLSKNMEGEYLPKYNNRPTHWHALYSDYFIENDLPLPLELEALRSRIARIASAHHRPDENSLAEMCVMIADRLSSGTDRIEDTEIESETDFRKSRLVSVFDEIELIKHTFEPPGNYYYNLASLEATGEAIFPKKGNPVGSPSEYEKLFLGFLEDTEKLVIDNGVVFYLGSLISLLEKYMWSIPSSSYKTLSDISLFDHSLSTAGIAQALFLYHKEKGSVPRWNDSEPKFLLLSGDLSGIQRYIFGISKSSGRGVSKIFRARSFFLQAITRSIILQIQESLGLHPSSTLVDSGGKFMLLVPNGDNVIVQLKRIDKQIQSWFRGRFKGVLTATFSWSTRLTQQDFQMHRFQSKIDEVNEALDVAKLRKLNGTLHRPVIDTDYDEFEGGNCSICGINAADDNSSAIYEKKEGVNIPVCRDCCDQIVYIGTRLPKTNYFVYGGEGKLSLFGNYKLRLSEEQPKDLRGALHIESLSYDGGFSRARIARHLPQITREELANEEWFKLFKKEDGFHEMVKGMEETDAFVPKTFGMIAEKSRKSLRDGNLIGRPLVAFLKADVDNLGLIFSMGLGDKLSVARLASLSRMLNIFFSEYVVELLRKEYPDIYVVFAGGDDLFLIGPWNETVEFAITLRKRLAQYCACNTDISLSCGILTGKPHLPIRKAAEITEEQLSAAKSYRAAGHTKDAVSFLGEVHTWKELELLLDMGRKFDKALEEKERTNFTPTFLYRLLTYHKMYRRFIHENDMKAGRYLSQAHYDIGRNIRQKKFKNQKELNMLYQIFAVDVADRKELDKLNIPIFYAMNLNRDFE